MSRKAGDNSKQPRYARTHARVQAYAQMHLHTCVRARTHAHTHVISLSLSLSHTHTHTGPPKRRRIGGFGPGGVRLGAPAQSLLRHIAVPDDQMAGLAASERQLLPTLEVSVDDQMAGLAASERQLLPTLEVCVCGWLGGCMWVSVCVGGGGGHWYLSWVVDGRG